MLKSADRVTEEKQKRLQIQNMERDRDFASMEAKVFYSWSFMKLKAIYNIQEEEQITF